ncbi:hypothetical protein C8J95_10574 [Elizabethkingia sp. YR214]|uniref:hypothetical protein n=1 Tax=Elizabethkingia sp. YR214 TaxID=2135667 RepID=UPI000D31EE96|nr:hypothetical protein [Elizabethkingia sp. YR214]PUB30756.1 hypothetical protein C8J95_10574 [Elizabethkingia sp. YR214]
MVSTDKEYVKIRIDGILNLEEISRSYEMTSKELMEFHNKHCALHELLTLTLPKYIEHLYIPERAFKKQESNQLKSTKLDLPNTESTKVYGVIVKFFPKELQLHYKINVKRTQNIIELVKEKTYINNQEITKVVEQIFEKAEQALYPLKIITDHNGDLLKIDNSEQIAERWTSKYLPMLREYYVSESAEEIIDELDKALKDVDAKRNMLTKNIFYRLFCLPVYQSYPDFFKKDILHIYFPGIPGEISYEVEYKLGKNYTRGNKIVLEIKGNEEESMLNLNAQKGCIDLSYKLHKETKTLFSITGVVSAFDHDIEQKIEFQLYELNS